MSAPMGLKPCPFCGGVARADVTNGDERVGYCITVRVSCSVCCAAIHCGSKRDANGWGIEGCETVLGRAAGKWNERIEPLTMIKRPKP